MRGGRQHGPGHGGAQVGRALCGDGSTVPATAASRLEGIVGTSSARTKRSTRPAPGIAGCLGCTARTGRHSVSRAAGTATARASSASHSRISISKMAHQNSAMKLAQLISAPAAGRISATLAASLPAKGAKDIGVSMTFRLCATSERDGNIFLALLAIIPSRSVIARSAATRQLRAPTPAAPPPVLDHRPAKRPRAMPRVSVQPAITLF